MENLKNNEKSDFQEQYEKNQRITNGSLYLLPIIAILSLVVGICCLVVKDFKEDISSVIAWAYAIVAILYSGISILDATIRKDKKFKLRMTLAILAIVSVILFIIFFYI